MEAAGKVNCYIARNFPSRKVFVINLSTGVTPFIHLFDGLECASSFYRFALPVSQLTITHAHYRPDADEFKLLDAESQEHVLNAGLICKPLGESRQLQNDPVRTDWDYEKFQEWCLGVYGRRLGPMERSGE